jgi:predicted O-linked N-acetylglucosamine transferase (SPINDLY family)
MSTKKVERNAPCPCGSGKKYKQCCLKRDETLAANRRTETTSISQALQIALGHYHAGRLSQAEAIYKQVLEFEPNNPEALHLLGVIAQQTDKFDLAVELISKAIRANPSDPMCYINLGNALKDQGKLDEAVENYQKALARKPDIAEAHYNLAIVLQAQGKPDAAVESYCKALSFRPNSVEAHNNLGLLLEEQGKLDEAIKHFRQALTFQPGNASVHSNLGTAYFKLGKLDAAIESHQKAFALKPDFAEAHNNMGLALLAQGKFDAAIASFYKALARKPDYAEALFSLGNTFQLQGKYDVAVENFHKALALKPDYAEAYNNLGHTFHLQGKFDSTIENYQKAISLKPDYAEAYYNMGFALHEQGKLDAVFVCYYKALSLRPNYPEAYNNLGNAYLIQGKPDIAVEHYHKALALNPNYVEAYLNLGNALKGQSKLDEAIVTYRKSLALKPDYVDAHSNLMFAMNFHHGLGREEVYRASQEYETQVGLPLRAGWPAHSNDRSPHRRLRVGYVSPDFRKHPVAYFAEPIFANHDKSQVEIFCYAAIKQEDEVTERFRQFADHWHSTLGLGDEAAANMIREHQIDILVDLAGHTAGNRLLVFARKPAPIQITYLGYPGTTGLSAMDYRLTDHYADPEGIADAFYSERLLRLPGSLWCYRPSADMPETSSLPALSRGYLTFGSFNNFNKVDQPTLEVWAELLRALPTARLMMLTVPIGEARRSLLSSFADLGISAERLELHGQLPPVEFHRKFLEVDITLDPVTVNGATTTCESLWMGVPVMSLVGDRFLTRAGLSLLSTAGLADFAAASLENYIRLAAHLADNLPLLAEIRAGLRAHVAVSPLVDEVGFTRNLEALYREVWRVWCGAPEQP